MEDQLTIDFEMTHDEISILALLNRGWENAVGVKRLSGETGLSDREVRATIKHLSEDHEILICSSTRPPYGYFYPQSLNEFKAGVKQYIHRIASLAKRLKAMDAESYREIFGQSSLFDAEK